MSEEINGILDSLHDESRNDAYGKTDGNYFDEVIGRIEDLLLEPEFRSIQQKFLDEYWNIFEPTEENKLIYTDIFNKYNKAIEDHIVDRLRRILPHFDIDTFLRDLNDRQSDLDGEVFEVLSTITDFTAFKEMVLDYRAVKEGKVQDLASGISITSLTGGSVRDVEPSV